MRLKNQVIWVNHLDGGTDLTINKNNLILHSKKPDSMRYHVLLGFYFREHYYSYCYYYYLLLIVAVQ